MKLSHEQLTAYMAKSPIFAQTVLDLLADGCRLSLDPTNYQLIPPICGKSLALGSMLELAARLVPETTGAPQ